MFVLVNFLLLVSTQYSVLGRLKLDSITLLIIPPNFFPSENMISLSYMTSPKESIELFNSIKAEDNLVALPDGSKPLIFFFSICPLCKYMKLTHACYKILIQKWIK